MSERNYSIAIPIILTLFFFASLAGIIGNAITFTPNTVNKNFDVDNLAPGDVVDTPVIIPEAYRNSEIVVTFSIKEFAIDFDFNISDIKLNLYFADEELPNTITNITQLEDSSYFDNSVTFSRSNVLPNSDVLYFTSGGNGIAYLLIGNPGNKEISIRVGILISNADLSSGENAAQILAIVFSSIFTGLFAIASAYGWFEILARNWYQPKVLTDGLEKRFEDFVAKAQSWELILTVVAVILVISGYSSWLIITSSNGLFFVGAVILGFIAYNYNSRVKLHESIRNILRQHPTTTLDELSNLVDESKEDLKKALLDMIIYENFPASFDFKTEEIKYDPSKEPVVTPPEDERAEGSKFEVPTSEVARERTDEDPSSSRPLPTCAYCGEEAINHQAKFCHACGASMTSAK